MKTVARIAALLLLLACHDKVAVTPDTITSIEYGTYFGFIGLVTKLTVYSDKQVIQPDTRASRTCEVPISKAEWNELTRLVDAKAFQKVKVGPASECPDAGSAWIIARSPKGEIKAEWGPCTGGDPTGIKPIIDALNKRMQAMQAVCK